MPAAIFSAEIDFSNGASFDPALVLDDPATPLDRDFDYAPVPCRGAEGVAGGRIQT
jgi:hypothetical protein